MTGKSTIPPELVDYVRNPLPEELTVEIFEDLHHVLDQYIVEEARERESVASDHDIIQAWEADHQSVVEAKREHIFKQFGALLPHAFISSNVKFEFLVRSGLPAFRAHAIPEDVVELMQEFVELLTYREELED